MIFDIASALMLTLGIYASWLARPSAERGEAPSDIGEYLGGLLIISGLTLLGWQLGHVVFPGSVRF
jgi:hypothetical protein